MTGVGYTVDGLIHVQGKEVAVDYLLQLMA
jgi:hypothetical protein